MKQNLKKYIKFGTLLFGVSVFVIACQKDDTISKEEQNTNVKTPIITTLSYEQTNETFNRLKDELKINPYLKQTRFSGLQARPTQDTLGLTIATDIIKQVTLGNYTSYTMEIIQETDSTVFFNLTIEDKNGESSMFVTKYTPTAYWLNNKNEVYQGDIQFREPATLTQWTDPNDIFEQELPNGGNPELGTGVGGGGGAVYSSDYPAGCFGTVVVTTQLVAYQCDCGDWPWDDCQGCTTSPQWPGFEQMTLYACEENWDIEDPYDPGDTGNSGGVSLPDPTDEPSISAMIKPEECIERLVGDIDGDCALSPYEWCLLGNNSQEICDCVAEGNTLDVCSSRRQCNKIKKIIEDYNPEFMTKVRDLKNKDGLTFETSVALFDDDTIGEYEGVENTSQVTLPTAPNSDYNAMGHVHNETDSIKTYSVPSLGDLQWIARRYKDGYINSSKYVAFLATADGTYFALTINSTNKFWDFFRYLDAVNMSLTQQERIVATQKAAEVYPLLEEYYNRDINPLIKENAQGASNNEQQLRYFMQFLNKADAGITVFETDESFTSFTELNLNGSNVQRDEEPCQF